MTQMDEFMRSRDASALLNDKDTLQELASSPAAQALINLLNRAGGNSSLQSAAQAAMAGNPADFMALMAKVMNTPEGAKAVDGINRKISK